MRGIRYTLFILALLVSGGAWGQYNPLNPDEPGVNFTLTLLSNPADGGRFNVNAVTTRKEGTTFTLRATPNTGYVFVCWTQGADTISLKNQMSFTMPARDVVLTAHFRYDPSVPAEPSEARLSHRLFLQCEPEGACTFNYTDGTAFEEGTTVNLRATAKTWYVFQNFTVGDSIVSTANTYKFVMPDHDLTLRANFIYDYNPGVPGEPQQPSGETAALYAMTASGLPGQTVLLPFYLQNTMNVRGAAFDLQLPQGFAANVGGVVLSERAAGATVEVASTGSNTYHVTLQLQQALTGDNGELFRLPVVIPDTATQEHTYPVTLSQGTVVKADGTSVTASLRNGSISVERKLPDLLVSALDCTEPVAGSPMTVTWTVVNDGIGPTGDDLWYDYIWLVPDVWNGTAQSGATLLATVPRKQPLGVGESYENTLTIDLDERIYGNYYLLVTADMYQVSAIEWGTVGGIVVNPYQPAAGAYTYIYAATDASHNRIKEFGETATRSDNFFYKKLSIAEPTIQPSLTLTTSSTDLTEGDTFQLTVALSRASKSPVTVQLACEDSRRFDFPSRITIPAGALSTTIDVVAIDDEEVTTSLTTAFKASAEGCDDSNEAVVILADNDMPELQLTLTPSTVSESAGISAIMGVVKRIGNLNSKVTIRLGDDSDGLLYYPETTLTMKKGESELTFSLGVIDDSVVNGNREVHLSAAVYVASCDCYSSGQMAGNVTHAITVLDDEGFVLKLTPSASAFLEGSTDNSITIERNALLDKALTVSLSSDCDDMLTYEHKVIIPARQARIVVPVAVAANDNEDDDKTITFTATAQGFTQGTCWTMVSDQSLPDAVITSFLVNKQEALAGDSVQLSVTIKNTGYYFLRKGTGVNFYFSGGTSQKSTIPERLYPGDSVCISTVYVLPDKTGDYSFYAKVNESRNVRELLYTNNVSERVDITLNPPYKTTISIDDQSYSQGEGILISGHAEGVATGNSTVEVYFICDGTEQTITVTTDADGNFSTTWTPQEGLSGQYTIGARYPGDSGNSTEVTADVYGLSLSQYYSTSYLYGDEALTGTITVTNPGNKRQAGLKAERADNGQLPCDISFDCPSVIEANQKLDISYTIKGQAVSEGDQWLVLPIILTTDEGAKVEYKLYYYVYPLMAKLEASPGTINTTMTYGGVREYPITIKNIGKGATGRIDVAVPEWMKTLTPCEMPSLEHGDSATVVLKFTTTGEMKLNVPVRGQIAINCENGDGLAMPFTVTPVSEQKGSLTVDVVDEYTFYTDEKPHVAGAYVTLKSISTGEIVAEGYTHNDGTCTLEHLAAGWYNLSVEADHHEGYYGRVMVDPGKEKREEVFVSYQAITYIWTVDETEVEDEYSVETVATYDTRVPKPIVIIDIPEVTLEPDAIIPVTLTNKGMISAVNVFVTLSISHDYEVEFVNNPSLDVLAPQQTAVFYAKVKPLEVDTANMSRMAKAASGGKRCYTVISKAVYQELCQKYRGQQFARKVRQMGKRGCQPAENNGNSGGSGGSGGGYGGSGGSGGGGGIPPSSPTPISEDTYTIWDDDPNPARYCKWAEDEEEPYDEVPDEEPEEADECDGEDGPIFDFKFVPAEGTRYAMNSIVADGESAVKIVLDPRTSKMPKEECDYGDFHWSIVNNEGNKYGWITNANSLDGAVYHAPEVFPADEEGSSVVVNLKFSFKYEGVEYTRNESIHLLRMPFIFCLADEKGNYDEKKPWRGVAADGASTLKIIIDPKYQKIPYSEFGYSDFHWEIEEKYGSFAKGNTVEDFFVAPEDYPQAMGGETTVQAVFHYSKNGKEQQGIPIDIVIARVPVVLLHGLFGSSSTWAGFEEYLTDYSVYDDYQVLNHAYKESNASAFKKNLYVPSRGISIITNKYRERGLIATKADLVGHSMGGVLARLHVEYVDNTNVHKLITVNTPHSGSEWGDVMKFFADKILGKMVDAAADAVQVKESKEAIRKILKKAVKNLWDINWDVYNDLHSNAVFDLGVNSDAIDNYLNAGNKLNRMNDIPVYAVTTTSMGPLIEVFSGVTALVMWFGRKHISLKTILETCGVLYELEKNLSFQYNDQIVSFESQQGGLYDNYNNVSGQIHVGSANNEKVKRSIWTALLTPVNSGMFATSGFHPKDRTMYSTLNADFIDEITDKLEARKKLNPKSRKNVVGIAERGLRLYVDGDSLRGQLNVTDVDNMVSCNVFVEIGNDFLFFDDTYFLALIPSTFSGRITATAYVHTQDYHTLADSAFVDVDNTRAMLLNIACNDTIYAIAGDSIFPQLECHWSDGSVTNAIPENIVLDKNIADYTSGYLISTAGGETDMVLHYKGLTCLSHLKVYDNNSGDASGDSGDTSPNICSSVSLSFKQSVVLTRQAFRGTLKVKNDSGGGTMRDVKINLEVRNSQGVLMTSREFQIDAETISGFDGELDLQAGWTLASGKQGVATVLFIPTKYAAPTEAQDYSFGGTFSYTDPATGMTIKHDLRPVTLTVKPSPQLDMTYFLQRDVFGDDPLTEAIEASKPAEFALLFNNKGYGDATKLSMTVQAPQIVENEKGLLVDFDLVGSALNGVDKAMALSNSTVTDFGTVAAHSQAYAQWWIQSSLLGHFTDYDISATHVTSSGNENLSLLDQVAIHELIHGFTPPHSQLKRAFLVNDIEDEDDLPDEVYFTDATQQHVAVTDNISVNKLSDTSYSLRIVPVRSGWNYGSAADPTNGRALLKNIVRQSDGMTLPVDNIWQTDRTLRDGKDPLYEYRLHFVGEVPASGDTYLLTFEARPTVELAVDTIIGLPRDGTVSLDPIRQLTVRFNKPVNASTFTTDDIALACQASRVPLDGVTVTRVDDKTFSLNMAETTKDDGLYVLTVQTAGITDAQGFSGVEGKRVMWTQYGGKPMLKVTVSPENSGTVTPAGGRYDYDTDVTLTATAAEGYTFTGWMAGEETLSTDDTLTYHIMGSVELTALFTPKHYDVQVLYDSSQGTVENGGTGIYDHGTQLHLTARPVRGYVFMGWRVNGEIVADATGELTVTVLEPTTVEALFQQDTGVDPNAPIPFADAEVKRICVENWDSSGDGELSYAEAAAVTDLGLAFQYNRDIVSFDELALFIGLTEIPEAAFRRCSSLKAVTLPEGLQTLGDRAFMECALQSVTIPGSMRTIGRSAFVNCDIASLYIPEGVTSIGNYLLAGNSNLGTITVAVGNKVYDSRNGCNAIIETSKDKLIQGCNNTVIPEGITLIADGAFEFMDIEYLDLPHSLKRFGMNAFYGCRKLCAIVFHEGLTHIGRYSFNDCVSLKEFHIPQSVQYVDGSTITGCDGITTVSVAEGNENYRNATGYNAITNADGTVLVMGCNATSAIPPTVKTIADESFRGRRKLTSIDIPEGVESIGGYAFCECSSLTDIMLPASITAIGEYAFASCQKLRTVIMMRQEPVPIGERTFDYLGQSTLYVHKGCKAAYEAADYWKDFKEIVEMELLMGDVNGDGSTDLTDAIMVVYHTFGIYSPGFIRQAADINGDSAIDLTDAITIIYKSLGAIASRSTDEAAAYPDDYMLMTAGDGRCPVALVNEGCYVGMQCDLRLPVGTTLEDVVLSDSRAKGHTAMWHEMDDGRYRVAVFSPAGKEFTGTMGELLTFCLGGMEPETVTLENIFLVDSELRKRPFPDLTTLATGIASQRDSEDYNGEAIVYDLQGRRVQRSTFNVQRPTLRKGIYIVNGRKVLLNF